MCQEAGRRKVNAQSLAWLCKLNVAVLKFHTCVNGSALVLGNGKNRATDQFLHGSLGDADALTVANIGQFGIILSTLGRDGEGCSYCGWSSAYRYAGGKRLEFLCIQQKLKSIFKHIVFYFEKQSL